MGRDGVSWRLRMSHDVSWRLMKSKHVSWRLSTSKHVSWLLMTSQNVSRRLRTSHDVLWRLKTERKAHQTSLLNANIDAKSSLHELWNVIRFLFHCWAYFAHYSSVFNNVPHVFFLVGFCFLFQSSFDKLTLMYQDRPLYQASPRSKWYFDQIQISGCRLYT